MKNTKKITLLITLLLSFSSATQAQFWNMVWADEFNGSTINSANWTMEIGTGSSGWGNNELQYYTARPENAQIINGQLAIIAKSENYQGSDYTSARMITQSKHDWKYGKIEARVKIPKQQGLWPAFWGLGSSFSTVGWPHCGEIDIMEHINTNDDIHGTIHWNANGYATYGGSTTVSDVSQYHTYAIEWDPATIKWFVDGTQYWSANILNNINSTDEFHEPFFLILNMAVGGNWPGGPASNFQQDTLFVDYVRVYENGLAPTAVNDIVKDDNISIYPNPIGNNKMINIELKTIGQYEVELIDQLGKIHATKSIANTTTKSKHNLSTSILSPGIYFLRVKSDTKISTHKVLITE